MQGFINVYHHLSRRGGEFSFNGPNIHATERQAEAAAKDEMRIEPCTKRIGIWRARTKRG
jgi:hypothetical protein